MALERLIGKAHNGDFWFFRLQDGPVLYFASSEGNFSSVPLEEGDIETLGLPTARRIDSKTVLPSSASLYDLQAAGSLPDPRSRDEWLAALKSLRTAALNLGSADPAVSTLIPGKPARQPAQEDRERDALGLVRALLETVAEIDDKAYSELLNADGEDDGYSSALATSITETLGATLNFQEWWSQDKQFSLQVHKEGFHLVFTLRDKTGQTYTFNERSGGMQYFISYFIQREAYKPITPGRSEILLMDEPDAYLSSTWQQDLLRVLSRYAFPDDGKPPAQVLYVTHSPFLIDKNYPHRIRVLQKGFGEEGTRVVNKAAMEQYEPLRSAFASFHADTAFIGTCNLLVEGPADLILFSGISAAIKRSAKPQASLDLNSLTMVPVHGAGNYRYMVHLTRGRDVDRPAVIVLLDSDAAGNRSGVDLSNLEKGFGKKQVMDPQLIFSIDALMGSRLQIDVNRIDEPEDLVPAAVARQALLHFLSEYRSGDSLKAIVDKLPNPLPIDPLLPLFDQLRGALGNASAAAGDYFDIGKVEFALAVSAVAAQDPSADGVGVMCDNFALLFGELNELQESALRQQNDERITEVSKRIVERFKRNHKQRSSKHVVSRLLDEIESHLDGIAGPAEEAVRRTSRDIRSRYDLSSSPLSDVENFAVLRSDLNRLVFAPES